MPHFILTTQLPSTSISTNVVNRLAMRTSCGLLFIALGPASVSAYLSPSGLGVCSSGLRPSVGRRSAGALQMEYIPDGLSKEQYQKIKTKDKANAANLGRVGVVRFKSRSFQAWQESGAGHLFPVDPKKVKNGDIPMDKVPYMQRGGAWDNSDLAGNNLKKRVQQKAAAQSKIVVTDKVSKKIVAKKWTSTDKAYANGGYVNEQSVSIFGGTSLPWTTGRKPAGVEWDNKRKLELQKGLKRPGTDKPMTAAVKRQMVKEAAEERKKQAKLTTQLKNEGKKGLFGLW